MDKFLIVCAGVAVGIVAAVIAAAFYPPTYITLNDSVFELFEVLRALGVFAGLLVGLKIADLRDPKQRV